MTPRRRTIRTLRRLAPLALGLWAAVAGAATRMEGYYSVYMNMEKNDLNFCNIDQPTTRNSIGPTNIATGDLAYYRFHGRNSDNWFSKDANRDARYDYLYSEEELEPWVRDIEDMEKRVEQIYVMTNNHYRGQAPVNALQMKAALGGAMEAGVLRRAPLDALSHLMLGALSEAAFVIANAEGTAAARRETKRALLGLLEGLRA